MLDPEIELTCPGCSRKFKKPVSRLQQDMRCPGCGKRIQVTGAKKLAATLKKVGNAFNKLGRRR